MDITILLICTGLSFSIVFIYGLQHTNMLIEKDLGDEHSVFYQVFSTWLNRQRAKYHSEKKRRAYLRQQRAYARGALANNSSMAAPSEPSFLAAMAAAEDNEQQQMAASESAALKNEQNLHD
mmetsp:Transcript_39564/g.51832  ORF Transcript_39564/g.51832 Transcript_39564/m.51832 type:complete len:122 (+) Transcript_39564:505-870(+)